MLVGTWSCPPGDPVWRVENEQRHAHLVAFPGTPVWIRHDGSPEVVADRNHVMYYTAGQRYRRRLLAPQGDNCGFIGFADHLAREVLAEVDPVMADAPSLRLRGAQARLDAGTFLRFRLALRAARQQPPGAVDPVRLAEEFYRVLADAVGAAYPPRRPPARSAAGAHARRELVEQVKALIAAEPGRRVSLATLAAAVHVSPYHLTRTFRAVTGVPLHRYLTDTRLRASVDLVLDRCQDLAQIAYELGFASHGHFTTCFTASFGAPPSRVRQRGAAPGNRARM